MDTPPVDERGGESDLRREVAQLLRLGPRRGVARFVKECSTDDKTDSLARSETVVRAVCAQSSTWIAEFKKRATRRAKCSPWLADLIAQWLETPVKPEHGTLLTADDVLRRYRTAQSEGTLRIASDKALGFGSDSDYFLAQLHTLEKQETPIDLTALFDCDHVMVHGLAMMAAWCERHAAKVQLIAESERVRRYLDETGFRNVIEQQVSIKSPLWDREHSVALTRIQREDKDAADEVAGRLTDLFRRHITLTKDQTGALTTMFAELVENVYRHAQTRFGSYVMAQAYPNTQRLHIVIADTGIGILESFRQSDRGNVRERAKSERDALAMAVEKLVTSKSSKHSGYGLFVVRRLTELNGGQMRITSGGATWETPARRKASTIRRSEVTPYTTHLPWNGTEVSLIIRLDASLPLQEVYKELGPPDRAEDFVE